MKSGKRQIMEEIELPRQKRITILVEKENFKYFGILEADTIKKNPEMKESKRKEHLRRTRKHLKTKLRTRNRIKRIKTLVVPPPAPYDTRDNCLKEQGKNFDKWTKGQKKIMMMQNTLNSRDGTAQLYVSRKEREREFASIENCMDASIQRLEDYIKKQRMTNYRYPYKRTAVMLFNP